MNRRCFDVEGTNIFTIDPPNILLVVSMKLPLKVDSVSPSFLPPIGTGILLAECFFPTMLPTDFCVTDLFFGTDRSANGILIFRPFGGNLHSLWRCAIV